MLKHRPSMLKKLALVASLGLLLVACESEAERQAKADQKAYQEKYAKAKALFEERCRTAGVVIHRTVQDVEGIELTKIRQPIPWGGKEYFDPMWPEAAMAAEYRGDDYINQFLMTESIDARDVKRRGSLVPPDFNPGSGGMRRGYRFVEVIDPATQQVSRAQFDSHPPGANLWGKAPRLTPSSTSATQYALDFEDILDPADRQHWIAGTRLRILDKQSGEVIAQLTRYVWDSGFGARSTGRWPWQHAASRGPGQECPSLPGVVHSGSRFFVDTVLIPKQGD